MKHEFEDPRVAKKLDLEHIYLAIVSSQYNRLQELCEICILENEYEEITRLLAMAKASHAVICRKESESGFDWGKIRYFEKCSKALHTPLSPIFEIVRFGLRTVRKVFS